MFSCLALPAARFGCPPDSVPGLRVAFVRNETPPVDFSGPGGVGSQKDWAPGADFGGRGEALLPGE